MFRELSYTLLFLGCVTPKGSETGLGQSANADARTEAGSSPDSVVDSGDSDPPEDTGTQDLDPDTGEILDDVDPDLGPIEPPETPLEGFIGSPCEVDDDCPYEGGVCLTEGFPEGHCSAPCDLYCPDMDGHPVTFCVDGTTFGTDLSGGWCVSRCSFGAYPEGGCRTDYGCRIESRHTEPGTETYSCIPGESSDLSACHEELIARGIGFEPTVRSIDYPDGRPDKECEIIDPVWVESPVFGVDLKYYDGEPTPRVLAGCEMAQALADTVEDVAPYGVLSLLHIGTYNCRMIAGTDSLSEHSFANAIDIYGFEFDDGRVWTLIDHWEHDTTSPTTDAGRFLYESAHRWHDEWIWNIILTPNYNLAHDNHFHVDLKGDYYDLSLTSSRYIGPAPYVD